MNVPNPHVSNSDKENKECWRDSIKPIGLLKKVCVLRGWPQPTFKGRGSTLRCYVNASEYKMKYFGKFMRSFWFLQCVALRC